MSNINKRYRNLSGFLYNYMICKITYTPKRLENQLPALVKRLWQPVVTESLSRDLTWSGCHVCSGWSRYSWTRPTKRTAIILMYMKPTWIRIYSFLGCWAV